MCSVCLHTSAHVALTRTQAEEKDYRSFLAQGPRKKDAIAAVARLAIDALHKKGFHTDEASLKKMRKEGAKRRKRQAKEEAKVIGRNCVICVLTFAPNIPSYRNI